MGVYSLNSALLKATKLELDLVEISPNAIPPVCKIIDYKKFLYEQRKKEIQKNSVIKKSTWQRSQVGRVEKNHLPK